MSERSTSLRPWHLRYLVIRIWVFLVWTLLVFGTGYLAAGGGMP